MSIVTNIASLKGLVAGLVPTNLTGAISATDVRNAINLVIDGAWERQGQIPDIYLGSLLADPVLTPGGNPLQPGMWYWNSTVSKVLAYDGTSFIDVTQAAAAAALSVVNAKISETNSSASASLTAADRVQTGLDVVASAASKAAAAASAAQAALAAGYGPIIKNDQIITGNLTLPSGSNGYSVGPIEIAAGVTVDISSGSVWAII